MAVKQIIFPAHRAFDSNGAPEAGATASLYLSGTLTSALFYSDAGLTVSMGSTITANSAGRFDPIPYGNDSIAYRLIIKDAEGATLDDIDPFYFGYQTGATGPAGAQGPAGDVAKVADRTTLAAIAATAGMTRYLIESGREGVFVFDSSNLSSKITLDPGQGVYVAPASAPTGASGAWVRKGTSTYLNLSWFGAVGDGITSDVTAVTRAFAYLRDTAAYVFGYGYSTSSLFVPKGTYLMGSTPIDVYGSPYVFGVTSGAAPSSIFKWTGACDGVRFQQSNTSGATTVGATGYPTSLGSSFRKIAIYGGFTTVTEGEYHGFRVKTQVTIQDCFVYKFPGDGVYANAQSGAGAPLEGNVNTSHFERVFVQECRNGFWLQGADANACTIRDCNATANRAYGFYDKSFLGNFYYGCHSAANGWDGANTGGTAATACSYSGNRYYVKAGQATGASTNAPSGTTASNTYWGYIGAGGAYGTAVPLWVSGTTFREGGSYGTDTTNANNVSKFDGCYAESDQNPAQVGSRVITNGGFMPVYGGGYIGAANNRLQFGDVEVGGDLYADKTVQATGAITGSYLGIPSVLGLSNSSFAHYVNLFNFGPSAAASDNGYYFKCSGNRNDMYFISSPGGADNTDGVFSVVRGFGMYLSGQYGIQLQYNGATQATVANNAINLATGTALQNNGTAVINGSGIIQQTAMPNYQAITKTAGYTETATRGDYTILCDLAAGFTVNLPTAVGNNARFTFKKMQSAGSIVIDGNASETIDGGLTATLTAQYQSITIVSDNANWVII